MPNAPVLVCGGAGYIGAHMCKYLAREGYTPVTFDNLSTGHRLAVRWGPFEQGDLLDLAALRRVIAHYRFTAVLHFAGRSQVSESLREPNLYLRTNVAGTINLLDAMCQAGVRRLVFSSTAAVYGHPRYIPIDEDHPTNPINPYGLSKWMAEQQITQYSHSHGLRAVCLRYFNAAGADSEGEIGEEHDPETHLIPNIIRAALNPASGSIELFGNDYDTPDGTCVRDYIHVEDLCRAHLAALRFLDDHDGSHVFNLGTGQGHSVTQVLEHCRTRCGTVLSPTLRPRRPGDPAALVASARKALDQLGWHPQLGLDAIVDSALRWHRRGSANPVL